MDAVQINLPCNRKRNEHPDRRPLVSLYVLQSPLRGGSIFALRKRFWAHREWLSGRWMGEWRVWPWRSMRKRPLSYSMRRGHRPHPDLQCQTAEAAGSVQQEAPWPLPSGKILRPGLRDLCAGQVQTVYPAASTVQWGTQTESERERKANRVQEQDEIL